MRKALFATIALAAMAVASSQVPVKGKPALTEQCQEIVIPRFTDEDEHCPSRIDLYIEIKALAERALCSEEFATEASLRMVAAALLSGDDKALIEHLVPFAEERTRILEEDMGQKRLKRREMD